MGTTDKELSNVATSQNRATEMVLVGNVIKCTFPYKDRLKGPSKLTIRIPVSNFRCFEVEADAKDSKASNSAS